MATQREFDGRLFSESVEALTIATGTKLSRYEIRSKIGEGGMGEVYLARDPKINREVRSKFYLPHFLLTRSGCGASSRKFKQLEN